MSAKSQNQKLFRIHVRPDLKPTPAQQGVVIDNVIVGDKFETEIAPTPQWIPNFYEALVVKKLTNGKYNGKFDWYDSNNPPKDGSPEQITVRFLATCQSLDQKYQEENGFVPSNEQEESGWSYPSGIITDIKNPHPLFVEFYEHHEMNGDNPLRDKRNRIGFYILDASKNVSNKKSEIEKDEEVIKYRRGVLDSKDKTIILASLTGVRLDYELEDKQTEVLNKIGRTYDEYQKFKKIEDEFVKEASVFLKTALNKKQIDITESDVVYDGEKYFSGFESKANNKEAICADLAIEIVNKESFYNDYLKIKKEIKKQ